MTMALLLALPMGALFSWLSDLACLVIIAALLDAFAFAAILALARCQG